MITYARCSVMAKVRQSYWFVIFVCFVCLTACNFHEAKELHNLKITLNNDINLNFLDYAILTNNESFIRNIRRRSKEVYFVFDSSTKKCAILCDSLRDNKYTLTCKSIFSDVSITEINLRANTQVVIEKLFSYQVVDRLEDLEFATADSINIIFREGGCFTDNKEVLTIDLDSRNAQATLVESGSGFNSVYRVNKSTIADSLTLCINRYLISNQNTRNTGRGYSSTRWSRLYVLVNDKLFYFEVLDSFDNDALQLQDKSAYYRIFKECNLGK
jgi:hypothetical protein